MKKSRESTKSNFFLIKEITYFYLKIIINKLSHKKTIPLKKSCQSLFLIKKIFHHIWKDPPISQSPLRLCLWPCLQYHGTGRLAVFVLSTFVLLQFLQGILLNGGGCFFGGGRLGQLFGWWFGGRWLRVAIASWFRGGKSTAAAVTIASFLFLLLILLSVIFFLNYFNYCRYEDYCDYEFFQLQKTNKNHFQSCNH